ncbi:MAG TPA: hypothetical protein VMZ69_01610, partial [Saprospiraceae bacterium]|nr:hypothetical protein [Saprospiraceae bacterium]
MSLQDIDLYALHIFCPFREALSSHAHNSSRSIQKRMAGSTLRFRPLTTHDSRFTNEHIPRR